MKALKSISYLLLAVLFSCNKKFKHSIQADNTPTSCKLCNYADNISGQYRGYASSEFNNYHDSVTVSIEHIFLNNWNQIRFNHHVFPTCQRFRYTTNKNRHNTNPDK